MKTRPLFFIALLALIISCAKDKGTVPSESGEWLEVDETPVFFEYSQTGSAIIGIESSCRWNLATGDSWCRTDISSGEGNGEIEVNCEENFLGKERETELTFTSHSSGDTLATVIVRQGTRGYHISRDYSRDNEVITLHRATRGAGIDFVILGDAFVDTDMDTGGRYEMTLAKCLDAIFGIEPMASFKDYFNVYGIKCISENDRLGEGMRTKLGVKRKGRTLANSDTDEIFSFAEQHAPVADATKMIVIVMVNDREYGGGAYITGRDSGVGFASTMFGDESLTGAYFEYLVVHEAVGHAYAKLTDEYEEGLGMAPPGTDYSIIYLREATGYMQNIDYTSDPEQVIWNQFLKLDYPNVGIFEGCYGYERGVWRSSETSAMRTQLMEFNPVCREIIMRKIYTMAGEEYSFEKFLEYDRKNIDPMRPAPKALKPVYPALPSPIIAGRQQNGM